MSREIKFRCWNNKDNRYVRIQNLNFVDNQPSSVSYHKKGYKGFTNTRYPNFILEQYTGLKDKNGKEIYEGDIVGIYNYYYNEETGKDEPGELEPWGTIVYEAPTFGLWGEPIYGSEDRHFFEASNGMVVMGNIHENPEILEENNEIPR